MYLLEKCIAYAFKKCEVRKQKNSTELLRDRLSKYIYTAHMFVGPAVEAMGEVDSVGPNDRRKI